MTIMSTNQKNKNAWGTTAALITNILPELQIS
jgi:hypothetical protein